MTKRSLSAVCLLMAIVGCCADLALLDVRASARATDAPGYWGFDTANLDKSCKPCDDFFQFAMGGWMKSNPIPPEYSTWGSFTVLADKNQQALRQILEVGCSALVLPEQINVGRADDAFDDMDNLKDENLTTTLKEMVRRLIDLASVMPKAVE